MKKRIIALLMTACVIFGTVCTAFASEASDPAKNSRWIVTDKSTVTAKYKNGDKFILVVSGEGDLYGKRMNDMFISWMDDNKVNIYSLIADRDDDVPDFVYDSIGNDFNTPCIVFAESKTAEGVPGADMDEKYSTAMNMFKKHYGAQDTELEAISVKYFPEKLVYVLGDTLVTNGLVLRAAYSDGTFSNVYDGYTCSGFSSASEGIKTVTVTYQGKTTGFNVTVSGNRTYDVDVVYYQTEARKMLAMTNEMRTSTDDAWCWNEDNTQKIRYPGLGTLTYDYNLEKVAMLRAAELVVRYGHTRPDGRANTTAITDGYNYFAENISLGYRDVQSAFDAFFETDKLYDEQGHRRNLLSGKFTCMACACASYDGINYWVQILRDPNSGAEATVAYDGEKAVGIDILNTGVEVEKIEIKSENIEMRKGEAIDLPEANISIKVKADTVEGLISKEMLLKEAEIAASKNWMSGDTNILRIENGKLKALEEGEAVIYISFGDKTEQVSVKVTESAPEAEQMTFTVKFGKEIQTTVTLPKDRFTVEKSGNVWKATAQLTNEELTQLLANAAPGEDYSIEGSNAVTVTASHATGEWVAEGAVNVKLVNPTKNAVLKAPGGSVDYRTNLKITATATGVPEGYYLVISANGQSVKGTNTSASLDITEAKADVNYSVKIVDAKGRTQSDSAERKLEKSETVKVNASFFKKLIAFFKGLFGSLPSVEIK